MKFRLLAKMMLFILLPAIVGMLILAGVSNRLSKDALEKQIFQDMALLASAQSGELENVIENLRGATDTLSEVRRIEMLLKALDQKAPPAEVEKLMPPAEASLASIVKNFGRIQFAGIVNTEGTVIATNRREALGASLKAQPFCDRTLKGESTVSTMRDRQTKIPVVVVTSAVHNEAKKVIGFVYVSLDMVQVSKETVGSVKIGQTGRCFVYDEHGTMLMHPTTKYIGDDDSQTPWFRAALQRETGREAYTFEGREALAFFTRVPNCKWVVMVSMDEEDIFSPITTMTNVSGMVLLLTMLFVGGIIFLFARNISGILRGGAAFTAYVAEGHLELPREMTDALDSAAKRTDEIGGLAKGVSVMVANLIRTVGEAQAKTREAEEATAQAHLATEEAEQARAAAEGAKREGMLTAATQLEAVVEIVTSASTELAAQIEQSERGSAEQASRLAETATAMEEMNSTVMEVARNAGATADVSASTRADATEGAKVVDETLRSIGEVQKQSLALKEDMLALGQQADAISQVMSVISDIADQTNLLALNAAIEAARAGDAGRGFAVVADEVRKLAEKTMHSTVDVSQAVKNIQESTHNNMVQVDAAVESIARANAMAEKSGLALQHIVAQADSTADQVRAIATASEQQSATSEEITRSVGHVNTIATETSRAMQEAAKAVSDLSRQAQILTGLIEDMKRG